MKYTTIQVTPRMRRRLAQYKEPGLSYEDVLEVLTETIPPSVFRARRRQVRNEEAERLRNDTLPSAEAAAEEARRREAARFARLSPGERMEEAYRLYELVRGRG